VALPVGVLTATVTIGPELDDAGLPYGDEIESVFSFVSSTPKVWSATSTPITPRPIQVPLDATGSGSIVLAATDQPGFTDGAGNSVTNWTYTVTRRYKGRAASTTTFQLPTAGATGVVVPLSSLAPVDASTGDAVAMPNVLSVDNGTGAINLRGTYFPAKSRGLSVVFEGDSITGGNNGGTLDQRGNSIPLFASIFANSRWRYLGSVAVPGTVLSQMIDRFDANVAPLAPSVVHLIAGTNNVSAGHSVGHFVSDLTLYLAKCQGIGARLVLGTLPPRAESTARRGLTLAYNQAAREFAIAHGLDLIDYYGLFVDPATGDYRAGYGNVDQTHPTNLANRLAGILCAQRLDAILPPGGLPMTQENADPNNLLTNGTFTGTITNSGDPTRLIPSGWTSTPSPFRTNITASIDSSDANIKGNWYVVNFAGATGTEFFVGATAGGTAIPGHRYSLRGLCRATGMRNADTGNGGILTVVAVWNSTDTTAYRARALSATQYDFDGAFQIEFTAPSDAATVNVQFQLNPNSGTGAVRFAQVGLYDLTAMGLV
jgi:lysophospholipase L1-like esterase